MNAHEFKTQIDAAIGRRLGLIPGVTRADVAEHCTAFPVPGDEVHYRAVDSAGRAWRIIPRDGAFYLRPLGLPPSTKRDSNGDRPLWLSAVYSYAISGLPLLLVREHSWVALCAWLFVAVTYLGMVRLFDQTRIEAGVISFMLACTLAAAIHAVHWRQEIQAEIQALEESREQRGGPSKRLE